MITYVNGLRAAVLLRVGVVSMVLFAVFVSAKAAQDNGVQVVGFSERFLPEVCRGVVDKLTEAFASKYALESTPDLCHKFSEYLRQFTTEVLEYCLPEDGDLRDRYAITDTVTRGKLCSQVLESFICRVTYPPSRDPKRDEGGSRTLLQNTIREALARTFETPGDRRGKESNSERSRHEQFKASINIA